MFRQSTIAWLLAGDPIRAKAELDGPPDWANTLFDDQCQLTPTGVEYNCDFPLSPNIRKALIASFYDNDATVSTSLSNRPLLELLGIIDRDGGLTTFGRQRAISFLPLAKQCEALRLPLEIIELPKRFKRVEDDVVAHYGSIGYRGIAGEGGPIQAIVTAMAESALEAWRHTSDLPQESHYFFVRHQLVDWPRNNIVSPAKKRAFLQAIAKCDLQNFSEQVDIVIKNSMYPPSWRDFLVYASTTLDRALWLQLAEVLAEHPFGHTAGWPDVCLVRDREVRFVEVKTTDKLHFSQIRLLPALLQRHPNVSVLRVKRTGKLPSRPPDVELSGVSRHVTEPTAKNDSMWMTIRVFCLVSLVVLFVAVACLLWL